MYNYTINKTADPISIDGKWNKQPWSRIIPLQIDNDNQWGVFYKPRSEVKLCYDDKNLYVFFRVNERYLKCETEKHNGPVWKDSCVEFFFSPDPQNYTNYFNIEINCCGYAYMAYQRTPRIDFDLFTIDEIKTAKIFHSVKGIVAEEIEQSKEWLIEYRLPFELITRYCEISYPVKGDIWMANFYKCAENNSHPHWLSWSKIETQRPDFHLTHYMGRLIFN